MFKREVPEPYFDFDDLEQVFGNLYLKSLAVAKSAEFVARIFAKSKFRYMVGVLKAKKVLYPRK